MSLADRPSESLKRLILYPKEDLDKEYKSWLNLLDNYHQAVLAKAILALANHGGGYVVVGFEEQDDKKLVIQEPNPGCLTNINQDAVNEIVEKFADPSFHCAVYHIESEEKDGLYPVIVVPGPHIVPIRAKRGGPENQHVKNHSYYIRRPGPISEPPQTGKEWDELLRRCIVASRNDLLDSIRMILSGDTEEAESDFEVLNKWFMELHETWNKKNQQKVERGESDRYKYGVQYGGYRIIGTFEEPGRRDLLTYLNDIDNFGTVFPMWMFLNNPDFSPYAIDDEIEAWNFQDRLPNGAHSEYWRASPKGMCFSLRGYFEDIQHPDNMPIGTLMRDVTPIFTVGMTLIHSYRLMEKLGCENGEVEYLFTWTGLKDRTIIRDQGQLFGLDYPLFRTQGYKSHGDTISTSAKIKQSILMENLQEHVYKITRNLYESFGFYEVSKKLIEQKVNQLLNKPQ